MESVYFNKNYNSKIPNFGKNDKNEDSLPDRIRINYWGL